MDKGALLATVLLTLVGFSTMEDRQSESSLNTDNRIFKVIEKKKIWIKSLKWCRRQNGTLAAILDEHTFRKFSTQLANKTGLFFLGAKLFVFKSWRTFNGSNSSSCGNKTAGKEPECCSRNRETFDSSGCSEKKLLCGSSDEKMENMTWFKAMETYRGGSTENAKNQSCWTNISNTEWRWSSKNNESLTFSNWKRNHYLHNDQRCLAMILQKNKFAWVSEQCNKKQNFICEFQTPTTTTDSKEGNGEKSSRHATAKTPTTTTDSKEGNGEKSSRHATAIGAGIASGSVLLVITVILVFVCRKRKEAVRNSSHLKGNDYDMEGTQRANIPNSTGPTNMYSHLSLPSQTEESLYNKANFHENSLKHLVMQDFDDTYNHLQQDNDLDYNQEDFSDFRGQQTNIYINEIKEPMIHEL